ncbi:MAG: glycosyltransferase [Thermoplasmata archaeon]|nr:glycosyltransferase [Thermoplasmata archaeon]
MRIFVAGAVLQESWAGGEPEIGRLLVESLRGRGIEVSRSAETRRGVALASLAATPWDADPVSVGRYRTRLRREQPDVVLGFFDYDTSLCEAAHRERIPFISCAHTYWPLCPIGTLYLEGIGMCDGASFGKCVRHLDRGTPASRLPFLKDHLSPALGALVMSKFRSRHGNLGHANRIVVPSRFMGRLLESYGYRGVIVVPNGIALGEIESTPWAGGPKTLTYPSGSSTERKGLGDFLGLASSVSELRPGTRFAASGFAGNGLVPPLPYLSRGELLALLRASYAVVIPIRWDEPFGLIAIEAMASGRPVVAYNRGAMSEIVVDGETGLLVPPGDRPALLRAVTTLLDDEGMATRLGAAGRRRVDAVFGTERMVDGYLEVVRAVLDERRPAAS